MTPRPHRHHPFAALALLVAIVSSCSTSEAPPVPPPPAPAHGTCAVTLTTEPGADLALDSAAGCTGRVTAKLRVATGSFDAPVWTDIASSPVAVEGAWEIAPGGVRRTVRVTNRSASPVSIVGLEWSFDVAAIGADRFFHHGYQSWAYTGLEAIPPAVEERRGTFHHGGNPGDALDELPGVGASLGAVVAPSGRSVLVGVDGGTVLETSIAADGTRLRLLQGGDLESFTLAPDASRTLDGLYVAMGDLVGALDAYAGVVASAHPSARPRKRAMGGWGSWNMYYASVSAADMRAETTWAKDTLVPRGLTDFLLDDGYEEHWGSWSAKPAFGASLEQLATEQTAAGLAPAVWLAPFVVAIGDAAVREHPEWFVGDPRGGVLVLNVTGNGDMAVLDPTSEGARTKLRGDLERLVAGGYRTFKLDFLYAGALPGVRKEPTTALESYARLFSIVREALGDAHIVGCGAPVLPTVGWVDSFRVGPDIAFSFSPEPLYPFLLAAARHTVFRSFTDRFWSLDPDVLLLRGERIDDVEAWTTTVATVLAGGNYLLGDGRQAQPARLAMALSPAVLALTRDGVAARPDDLSPADPKMIVTPALDAQGVSAVPHVWRKTSADGKTEVVAVFGWDSDPFDTRVTLPRGAEEIRPNGERTPAPSDGHVVVARHAARLFVGAR